ncbi:hypothetical protein NIES267_55130 [Calothrix parasitica NIES-267]|uniref:Uncharacterized protein n=1 Tax=Calothrix parasitica NIES-267 TaxID=1973488 RepID=A0A1Z4LXN0_9CYAN|nr:hypothetical protein NIES267_55130 [Calothrix parasitica NIES-267]
MTKHDTWVTLKPDNPLSEIINLFPEQQIPMRDPFPMELVANGQDKAALFVIDLDRLSSIQATEITKIYARTLNASVDEIFGDALTNKGFAINSVYVDKLFCGDEGYQRTREVADFYDRCPNPTLEQIEEFMQDQRNRWIDGNEQPQPMPKEYQDFDPRIQTPELEDFLEKEAIEQHYANYSVLDVLTGKATVDFLNKQNPDYQYELVGLEEMLEDD